jgi:hypothetical protein
MSLGLPGVKCDGVPLGGRRASFRPKRWADGRYYGARWKSLLLQGVTDQGAAWVEIGFAPPRRFVAPSMEGAVMRPTERDCKFVADPASQRPRLHESPSG